MISRYVFRVLSQDTLPSGRAYAFYSCLLSLLPEACAVELHEQGETPISQCLYREKSETLWQMNLLDQDMESVFSSILDELKTLPLNTGEISLELQGKTSVTAEELIKNARALEADRFFAFRFLSPTAFKQNGKYTVLPEKELILQSLLKKWNSVFPSYPLEDEDAFHMLSDGLRISDYNLHTTRFFLKDNKIPGFVGNMSIDARLSTPILDIWRILVVFSEYSGIGIKTALGMGGVKLL